MDLEFLYPRRNTLDEWLAVFVFIIAMSLTFWSVIPAAVAHRRSFQVETGAFRRLVWTLSALVGCILLSTGTLLFIRYVMSLPALTQL